MIQFRVQGVGIAKSKVKIDDVIIEFSLNDLRYIWC